MAAVAACSRSAGASAGDVESFAHGMTVATNALLEGKVARTAFVATAGFTDLVALGRQARRELYRLCAAHPAPLTPPSGASPRASGRAPTGSSSRSTSLDALVDDIAAASPRPWRCACCTATAIPTTSARSAMRCASASASTSRSRTRSWARSASSSARQRPRSTPPSPPCSARYLRRLLGARGRRACPRRRSCSPAAASPRSTHAADHAALTVLSGPAGGAAAAALLAARCGEPDLLCFDMGGTSCDVCVVEDGRVRETTAREVGGRPLALPMVDIHTVGAGGGSIAWRDAGGALRVGPHSAGAEPGPACYGRGGTEPTVTDANLVLGHLSADAPLAGDVVLDARRRARGRRARWRTARPRRAGVRRGHRPRGQRRDGARAAGHDRRARRRPAALRAAGLRRRRAAARRRDRRRARDDEDPRAARLRRAQRPGPGRCRPPRRRPAHACSADGEAGSDALRDEVARDARRRAGDRARLGPSLPRAVARADGARRRDDLRDALRGAARGALRPPRPRRPRSSS